MKLELYIGLALVGLTLVVLFAADHAAAGTHAERGFATSTREGNSGLLHMGARHYDPSTGRFLQIDPLGIGADQLYAYAAHNPYLYWDPTGFEPQSLADSDEWEFLDALMLTQLSDVSPAFNVPGTLAVIGAGGSTAAQRVLETIPGKRDDAARKVQSTLLEIALEDERLAIQAAIRNPTDETMARMRVAITAAQEPQFREDLLIDSVPSTERNRLSRLNRLTHLASRADVLLSRVNSALTAYDVARFAYRSRNRAPSESIAEVVYSARDTILYPLGRQ